MQRVHGQAGGNTGLMNILVTGAASFIGATVAERLLARGEQVPGVDNLPAT